MDDKQPNQANGLFLDDFHVGQLFHGKPCVMDAEQIKAFAKQFDPQPFHTDEEAAKKTFFGGLVASGWHTAAITMRMLIESMPVSGGLVGAGGEVEWLRPTKPGDTLHVETEVLDIRQSRSRPNQGMVTIRTVTRNQDGKLLQRIKSRLVVPTRESSG